MYSSTSFGDGVECLSFSEGIIISLSKFDNLHLWYWQIYRGRGFGSPGPSPTFVRKIFLNRVK
jgi:hypothetical protein